MQSSIIDCLKSWTNPSRIEQISLWKLRRYGGVMTYTAQFTLIAAGQVAFQCGCTAPDHRRVTRWLCYAHRMHPGVQENVHEQQQKQPSAQLQENPRSKDECRWRSIVTQASEECKAELSRYCLPRAQFTCLWNGEALSFVGGLHHRAVELQTGRATSGPRSAVTLFWTKHEDGSDTKTSSSELGERVPCPTQSRNSPARNT